MRMNPFLLVLPLLLASWPGVGIGQEAKEEEKEKARPQSVQSVQSIKRIEPIKPAALARPAQQAQSSQPARQEQARPAAAARLPSGVANQVNPNALSQQAAFQRELGAPGGVRFEQLRAMRLDAEALARIQRARNPRVVPQNKRDFRRYPGDCNDRDPSVRPGQVEVCNFKDDNCDGDVDEGVAWTVYRDQDGDGFGDPAQPVLTCPVGDALANVSLNNRDCDDTDRSRNPSQGTCP